MKSPKEVEFLTFNDGKVTIDGHSYNFGERTVSMNRHFAAKAAGTKISRVVHILYTDADLAEEKAVIGDIAYIIEQAQPTRRTCPPCTVLTLRYYGVNRNECDD